MFSRIVDIWLVVFGLGMLEKDEFVVIVMLRIWKIVKIILFFVFELNVYVL